jgi:phosphoglycolate phosphatase
LKKKIILFDLDGVIIDSKSNMKHSWNFVKKKYGINNHFNEYFRLIGIDFHNILMKMKINNNRVKIEKDYIAESQRNIKKIKLFTSVKKVLSILNEKGLKIGIVTSKDCKRTQKILNRFNLKFDIIRCANQNYKSKPNPHKILSAIKELKISRKKTLYIGDMFVDELTAKNAKVDYIHANYGYSPKKISTKFCINKFGEIISKFSYLI